MWHKWTFKFKCNFPGFFNDTSPGFTLAVSGTKIWKTTSSEIKEPYFQYVADQVESSVDKGCYQSQNTNIENVHPVEKRSLCGTVCVRVLWERQCMYLSVFYSTVNGSCSMCRPYLFLFIWYEKEMFLWLVWNHFANL